MKEKHIENKETIKKKKFFLAKYQAKISFFSWLGVLAIFLFLGAGFMLVSGYAKDHAPLGLGLRADTLMLHASGVSHAQGFHNYEMHVSSRRDRHDDDDCDDDDRYHDDDDCDDDDRHDRYGRDRDHDDDDRYGRDRDHDDDDRHDRYGRDRDDDDDRGRDNDRDR